MTPDPLREQLARLGASNGSIARIAKLGAQYARLHGADMKEHGADLLSVAEAATVVPSLVACLTELLDLADEHDSATAPWGPGLAPTSEIRERIAKHFPAPATPEGSGE